MITSAVISSDIHKNINATVVFAPIFHDMGRSKTKTTSNISVLLYLGGPVGGAICHMQCNTSPPCSRSGCWLWNVGPLLFNGCGMLLDTGRNWDTLASTSFHRIPNLLNGWHVQWVCWDVFSFQGLLTAPGNIDCAATWGEGRWWMEQQWASGFHNPTATARPPGTQRWHQQTAHTARHCTRHETRDSSVNRTPLQNAKTMKSELIKSPRARRACRWAKENDEKV